MYGSTIVFLFIICIQVNAFHTLQVSINEGSFTKL